MPLNSWLKSLYAGLVADSSRIRRRKRKGSSSRWASSSVVICSRVSEALEDRQLLTSITDVQGDFNLGGQIQSFVFEIGGLQPGETSTGAEDGYDQINVSGRLFGTADIEVKLLGGFEPQAGQVFTLMTYDAAATDSTSSHFFDSATGLYGFGDGSLYFDVVQDVNKIQLVVSELGTPSLLK